MIIDWEKINKDRELTSQQVNNAEKAKTSAGERKMRSALITSLLELHEDKKYDIAASLAANIGYKLVAIGSIDLQVIGRIKRQPIDESDQSSG